MILRPLIALAGFAALAAFSTVGCESHCPLDRGQKREFIQLASDGTTILALQSNGRTVCWGEDFGQCGFENGGGLNLTAFDTDFPDCATSIDVSAIGTATLYDGSLAVWGGEQHVEFGDGPDVSESYDEMSYVPIDEQVVQASIDGIGMALTEGGDVYAWGLPKGDSFSDVTDEPRKISLPAKAIQVSAGVSLCALLVNGDLYCVSTNVAGEIGDGTLESRTEFTRALLPGPAVRFAQGFHSICAVLRSGEVACWGRSSRGPRGADVLTPTLMEGVEGMTDIRMKSDWDSTCAFKKGGKAMCWGGAFAPFLPEWTPDSGPLPFPVFDDIIDIAFDQYATDGCVIRASDNWVYCSAGLKANPDDYQPSDEWAPIPEPQGDEYFEE